MAGESKPSGSEKASAAEERRKRLAEALRRNLRHRKAAGKAEESPAENGGKRERPDAG